MKIVDGNQAAAEVAYALSEVVAIYPITPASPMGEWSDQWSAEGRRNLFGSVPKVVEMQSEAGAAGALHGAATAGALVTTFTASQGLLLMLPDMYKLAGELTPAVIHVAARSVAAHALSIFGDHSDVMAARTTGFALLASSSVQEACDLALVAHAAALDSRVPFLHFFDGFRTSHELACMEPLGEDALRAVVDAQRIEEHRRRGLTPDRPTMRGTAQNPDVFFQAREASNPFYRACPSLVSAAMERLAEATGRRYRLFDYFGDPDARQVVVMMGSGAWAARQAARALIEEGRKVGVVTVRLYRPFDAKSLLSVLPASVEAVATLDRTKEPGAPGEPLFLDVASALQEAGRDVRLLGGRYGLASKEFTPAMAKAVFDELERREPKRRFTIGIRDDVTHESLEWDPRFRTEDRAAVRAVFFGLGSDGTVGANKSSVKIIGERTGHHAQAYFVYDSKKSGSTTQSHLRFGPEPIDSPYLIERASFVACHQFGLLNRLDVLSKAEPGAVFLLNSPFAAEDVWDRLPAEVQRGILEKSLRFHVVDAYSLAKECGLGRRINTIMQACFFALTDDIPKDEALSAMRDSAAKTYGKLGPHIVEANLKAIDGALARLHRVELQRRKITGAETVRLDGKAPRFVREVTSALLADRGDELPVSALPPDGTFPTGTSRWEKRAIAEEIPVWDPALCIQCGKCVIVCPHAAIRAKTIEAGTPAAPELGAVPAKWADAGERKYVLATAPDDCTGCGVCFEACPVKDKRETKRRAINMVPIEPVRDAERRRWAAFTALPESRRTGLKLEQVKDVQLLEPLFEFSGACAGCGETPYLKLLTQLFGDRLVVANATGCSSIYGGNLPTTPWSCNAAGKGPAWSNSLFEDNAEFGLGMRLALDQRGETGKSVWLVGGDGWAYDIGYGGLDHVLASGQNVKVLVLDTEVYSNTGGQKSKSTPRGAVAKFASAGQPAAKKDLALLAMIYGNVYVARVALGAADGQSLHAFLEAESFQGPSLILAYSPCIAHGYDLRDSLEQQKLAVASGYWPLFRFDPRRAATGKNPFQLDSKPPSLALEKFESNEARFSMLSRSRPEEARRLLELAEQDVKERWRLYSFFASKGEGGKP